MIPIVLTHGGRSVVYGSLFAVSAVVHGLVYVAGAAQDSRAVVAANHKFPRLLAGAKRMLTYGQSFKF
jgi:hypothetical protein